jgi:hypothetical protein
MALDGKTPAEKAKVSEGPQTWESLINKTTKKKKT